MDGRGVAARGASSIDFDLKLTRHDWVVAGSTLANEIRGILKQAGRQAGRSKLEDFKVGSFCLKLLRFCSSLPLVCM